MGRARISTKTRWVCLLMGVTLSLSMAACGQANRPTKSASEVRAELAKGLRSRTDKRKPSIGSQ
jgi:hypothetical protein